MEEFIQTYIETGKAYIEKKNYNLAIEQFNKALEKGCPDEQAHFELGKVYYILNEHLLAIRELREAIEINPENPQAHFLLAKTYRKRGENKLAADEFRKALDRAGDEDEQIHMELANLFQGDGLYDLAIKEYEEVLKKNSNKEAILKLIQLYNFQGYFELTQQKIYSLIENPLWQELFFKNRLLNELEISQKKLVLTSKPRIMLLALTNRCNLNCYMCGKGNTIWDISSQILEYIDLWLPFLELITWQGGEVFLAECFGELLQKTTPYKNLKQIIITNGLLINKVWAQRLTSLNNVDLTISIDGVDKETYEYIRRGASFEKLAQNIRLINQVRKQNSSKMITTLRGTIMKINHRDLERFVEFAREYEFDVLLLVPISTEYDPEIFDPQDIFNHKDKEAIKYVNEIKPKIKELAARYKIKLLDLLPALDISDKPIDTIDKINKISDAVKRPLCFRPWKQLAMNVKGKIFPECLCSEPIGDIFKNSLDEVWNNEKMQMYRKKLLENEFTNWCGIDCASGAIPPEHLKFTFV